MRQVRHYTLSTYTGYNLIFCAILFSDMLILSEYNGTPVNLDCYDGDLYKVLAILSDAARQDGFLMLVDRQIKGKIQVTMDEPWNIILVEILAGVNFLTVIANKKIIISLLEGSGEKGIYT